MEKEWEKQDSKGIATCAGNSGTRPETVLKQEMESSGEIDALGKGAKGKGKGKGLRCWTCGEQGHSARM